MEFKEEFENLNVDEFKKKYFKMLSPYFNEIFWDYFKKVKFWKENEQNGVFYYEVVIDERCANPLQIVHGGALATLIENLATSSLFYFSNVRYKTLDISINYKNQVPLNKMMQIWVNCQKVGSNTSFVEVQVKGKDEGVCTQASIIKSKVNSSKNKDIKNAMKSKF